jgi:glycosyltransferase involved in cell wall biosynthesis
MSCAEALVPAPVAPRDGFSLSAGRYVVTAKAGDPILRPARARLIWAANTAAATAALGVPAGLVGGVSPFPYKVETVAGKASVHRALGALYGVAGGFELYLLQDDAAPNGQDWTHTGQFIRQVLPDAGLVHTRDPLIAVECARRGISYVFEDHDEDYQLGFHAHAELRAEQECCRAIVAITGAVRRRLLAAGLPDRKIIVLESGVNRAALQRHPAEAEQWRRALLAPGYAMLVAYTGGLQQERGIEHILRAALDLPKAVFVLAGGTQADQTRWSEALLRLGLGNVRLLGYQDHETVCVLQQAADVVLATREAGPRAAITSPLKLYEYLLSGTPFVAAAIPAVDGLRTEDLAGTTYDPREPTRLASRILEAARRFPRRPDGYAGNRVAGEGFTWEERQRRLMGFIGPIIVRRTY